MRSVILAVVLLSGCAAPTVWTRPGAVSSDFERDRAQCQYEGAAATANYNTGPTARSYGGAVGQGIGEGIAIAMRRNELFTLCMQARGYRQRVANN
jgi:hypothetical protein